ncbi:MULTISPECIES: hypothetical protein [Nocardia]|uniref:DUF4878 domain-containing protein n=1 Tax=Nocardia sputorum TaxID=2984338 RepID=A0ABN6U070_9NOCA|nr:hypothetical protein [Nocardia sputorum]BDT96873.1 hypothetical protein IFM12275_68490 [Nocardia sputorum]BDT98623.1 hypothetical protein IFM12276_16520 [Nocardia sputorum]
MNRTSRALSVLGAVSMPVLVLAGCGGTDADAGKPGEPTAAALRAEATKMTEALASHDYAAAYRFRSARCRLTLNEDDYAASMAQLYDGRDLKSKPAEITVTTSGSTGTVTVKNFDARAAEDDTKPKTWTFVDGQWRFDNC